MVGIYFFVDLCQVGQVKRKCRGKMKVGFIKPAVVVNAFGSYNMTWNILLVKKFSNQNRMLQYNHLYSLPQQQSPDLEGMLKI